MDFFTQYEKHVKEREALGVPPLPLNEEQTRKVCELLKLERNGAIEEKILSSMKLSVF